MVETHLELGGWVAAVLGETRRLACLGVYEEELLLNAVPWLLVQELVKHRLGPAAVVALDWLATRSPCLAHDAADSDRHVSAHYAEVGGWRKNLQNVRCAAEGVCVDGHWVEKNL